MTSTRRDFLKITAASAMTTVSKMLRAEPHNSIRGSSNVDLLRPPDSMLARLAPAETIALHYSAGRWTGKDISVRAEVEQNGSDFELPVLLNTSSARLTHLQLRWHGRNAPDTLMLGDAWERSYGDLEWRSYVPQRVMPWYFLLHGSGQTTGYGVRTQPGALCFWQNDPEGMSLWLDLRNGGEPTLLGDRELKGCIVVMHRGRPEESIPSVAHEFCRRMCRAPRLPKGPIFGSNDWNYAYGKNTASGILRDADLVMSLAPTGSHPYVVIDDGWQDKARFPSLPDLASQIRARSARPGIWVRPLRAPENVPLPWLLSPRRFGGNTDNPARAFDPTVPEALHALTESVRAPVSWGYEFIKHDFSTFDMLGRWGSTMGAEPANPGWRFHDRSRTTAEIITDLYQALRAAAGEQVVILGCNTMGHLAAGIFESQRIADDTSGREWERTRRFGVNGLANRIAQHRSFFHIDPDIVAITKDISWTHTSQWMDLVARSGTSLFFAPAPDAITPEVRSAMRNGYAMAVEEPEGLPLHVEQSTTPEVWQFDRPQKIRQRYHWSEDAGAPPFLDT